MPDFAASPTQAVKRHFQILAEIVCIEKMRNRVLIAVQLNEILVNSGTVKFACFCENSRNILEDFSRDASGEVTIQLERVCKIELNSK